MDAAAGDPGHRPRGAQRLRGPREQLPSLASQLKEVTNFVYSDILSEVDVKEPDATTRRQLELLDGPPNSILSGRRFENPFEGSVILVSTPTFPIRALS